MELQIHDSGGTDPVTPVFYFDLGDPESYLVAERILQTMPVATEWIPVLAAELPGHDEQTFYDPEPLRATLAERGLQALRMPPAFPFDSSLAQLAATYAKQIGRTVPFALAAFRQCFAAGRPLDVPDNVLIAGSACEMHPTALAKSASLRSTAQALAAATALAAERGARDTPAIWLPERGADPERIFHGDAHLDAAALATTDGSQRPR